MQILADLIVGLIHLLRGVLDIAIVCFLVHGLARWWPHRVLVALDGVGRPVVDTALDITTDTFRRVYNGELRSAAKLGICLLVLTGIHALFSGLISVLM